MLTDGQPTCEGEIFNQLMRGSLREAFSKYFHDVRILL